MSGELTIVLGALTKRSRLCGNPPGPRDGPCLLEIEWDMAHITGTDRAQVLLLPDTVDDYVDPDNPVRFIDAFVDSLDLAGAGFERAEPKRQGARVGSGRLAEAASQIGFHWACAASKSPQRTNFLRQPFTGLAGAPLTQPTAAENHVLSGDCALHSSLRRIHSSSSGMACTRPPASSRTRTASRP